jgi:hypothetical protein
MILSAKSEDFIEWSAKKDLNIPSNINDLKVSISDINHVSKTEISQIKQKLTKFNCCIYASGTDLDDDSKIMRFAQSLGMRTFDSHNIDDSAISTISANKDENNMRYIPYTNKGLNWHTDGYYDSKPIFSWLLHCIEPALSGGENFLLDHELAIREYILKYDDIIYLTNNETFSIPTDEVAKREITSNYVCDMNNEYKKLHMNFSMRKENIIVNKDSESAMSKLIKIIKEDCKKYHLTYKLSKSEGIVSNNILHGRNAFKDGQVMRKILRIRSHERL